MRLPATPPNTMDIWKRPGFLDKVVGHLTPDPSLGYVHWDRLRRLPNVPKGLSHEEWWTIIKMGRTASRRQVPIKDINGRNFAFSLPDEVHRYLHEIDRRAGGVIAMPEQVANPQTRDQYLVSSLINEAITSSQLEGAVTTRAVAKEMIRTRRKPRDRSEKMILNNYLTMRRIIEVRAEPLTKDLVFELHRTVTEETLETDAAAGRFRADTDNVRIEDDFGKVFHTPPPADQLESRMQALCHFANAKTPNYFLHPVVRAILLHFWLAYDHPFVDGNGRTARALFYWAMLHNEFWLFEFISISNILLRSPKSYYLAFLYSETDENDATYFVVHQLNVIEKAIQSLYEYIAKKTAEFSESDHFLRNWVSLNHRQVTLISNALRHPGTSYTVEGHQTSHGIVYETARRDLMELVDAGLLVKTKRGRTMIFRTPEDFCSRIKRGALEPPNPETSHPTDARGQLALER
jgi:Fic family protein